MQGEDSITFSSINVKHQPDQLHHHYPPEGQIEMNIGIHILWIGTRVVDMVPITFTIVTVTIVAFLQLLHKTVDVIIVMEDRQTQKVPKKVVKMIQK